MFYLRYLCLFAYSFVKHILCCVFVLIVFVLCFVYGGLEHIIVFCFILLVFVVAYPNVASFSGFSILEYPFLFSCA